MGRVFSMFGLIFSIFLPPVGAVLGLIALVIKGDKMSKTIAFLALAIGAVLTFMSLGHYLAYLQ